MIRIATEQDYPMISAVWEASVQATHHFLPEDYFNYIKTILPTFFPAVQLYVWDQPGEGIHGFLGVADHKIEMLFIHPVSRGKGIGKQLALFAITNLEATKLDVNEQNEQAVGFYRHLQFEVTGRSATDGLGKPFPLLHMELKR